MKQKGLSNIKIADHLDEKGLEGFEKSELYSAIVSRWYYGAFMVAKSYCDTEGNARQPHKDTWREYANKQHEDDHTSHYQSIEALSRDLRSLRNIFDYQHDSDKVKLLSDYNDAKEYCSKLKEKMKLEL